MKQLFYYLLMLILLCSINACGQQAPLSTSNPKEVADTIPEATQTSGEATLTKSARNIPVYDFKTFEPLLHINNDTTYVVNFWATWCKPCVAELPYFEQLNEAYKAEKVKVLLVSLDFSSQLEKKVIPFLEKRALQSEVILLDDPDANSWIDKVDANWSGAIPATVIFKGTKRGFFERSFESYEDLVEVMEGVVSGNGATKK
jgi:thiol-disulfide isomerase/thioredoxin